MRKVFLIVCLLTHFIKLKGQELYPNSEPASIIPKNTLGVRLMNEAYETNNNIRSWHGAMFMYGLNSKLMFNAMFTTSNHHPKNLPSAFIQGDSNNVGTVNPGATSNSYSYLFESVNLGFRYRFLNRDGDHKHFRMALYSNAVYSYRPHDEAEVSLMGDNKAIGGGIISTVLIKKLAVSFTGGAIVPFAYKEKNIALNYGNAYNYSLSFGYLVYPFKYSNFKQTNINLYAEFLGKTYRDLTVKQNQKEIAYTGSSNQFTNGNYVEFRPAVQFIIKSNLRIDCSAAFPIVNRSYIRQYPLYLLNIQYYFFL